MRLHNIVFFSKILVLLEEEDSFEREWGDECSLSSSLLFFKIMVLLVGQFKAM